MAKSKTSPETVEDVAEVEPTKSTEPKVAIQELASAFTQAIEKARPEKKTIFNRKKNTPWTPKDGSPKLKLRRKMYHHSLPVSEKFLSNEEIEVLNKIKVGTYCEGWVKVRRRNDKGIDIDYPIKTNAQRLRLLNKYGTDLVQVVTRCLAEQEDPKKYAAPEDLD